MIIKSNNLKLMKITQIEKDRKILEMKLFRKVWNYKINAINSKIINSPNQKVNLEIKTNYNW